MTTTKFDGSNTNRYSRYEKESYIGFKVTIAIMALMALVIALFLGGVIKAHALTSSNGQEYVNPYEVVCFDPLMSNVTLTLPSCFNGGNTPKVVKHGNSETSESVPAVITVTENVPPTIDPVVIVPPTNEPPIITDDNSKHCNAGRGNGSEGNPDCDPGNSGNHNHGGD